MSAAAQVVPIQQPKGSLWQIVEHLEALFDTVDLVAPEQRDQIDAELAAYVAAEIRKVDGIARYMAHCEAQQRFAAEEIRRLQDRKSIYERREEKLKERVIGTMELHGLKKLEGQTSTLSLRPCPPSVKVLDEDRIPAEYKIERIEWVLDKKAIKAALVADVDVPGADLWVGKMSLVRR